MKVNEDDENKENSCIFLGLKEDPMVCFAYVNSGNYCYKVNSPAPVDFIHQDNYCLSDAYIECEVYRAEQISRLPKEIRHGNQFGPKGKFNFREFSLFGLLDDVATYGTRIIGFLGSIFKEKQVVAGEINLDSETKHLSQLENTHIASQVVDMPNNDNLEPKTSTANEDPIATPNPSVIPTLGSGLLTLFGPNNRFLLHQFQLGEGLDILAERYTTTIEVLSSVNVLDGGGKIWVGQVLLVMPGQLTTDDIEGFHVQVIQLKRDLSIAEIAVRYGVTAKNLCYINGLGTEESLPGGRWLIVPTK